MRSKKVYLEVLEKGNQAISKIHLKGNQSEQKKPLRDSFKPQKKKKKKKKKKKRKEKEKRKKEGNTMKDLEISARRYIWIQGDSNLTNLESLQRAI